MQKGCYILFCKELNDFEIGVVVNNDLNQSIANHIKYLMDSYWECAKKSDWEEYLKIETDTYEQSLRIEELVRSTNSKKFIRHLKEHPELLESLKMESLELRMA